MYSDPRPPRIGLDEDCEVDSCDGQGGEDTGNNDYPQSQMSLAPCQDSTSLGGF